MRQSYHDGPHRKSRDGIVDGVVGLDVADFLDCRAKNALGSFVDEGSEAVDCHVLHIAIAVVERVNEAVDDSRACGVVVNEEGGRARLEHSVKVIEGHVSNIGVWVVEFG
jgi:hypothetical protein